MDVVARHRRARRRAARRSVADRPHPRGEGAGERRHARRARSARAPRWRSDPFWGVGRRGRRGAGRVARAVGARGAARRDVGHAHPKVRRAVADALGDWRDAEVATALLAMRDDRVVFRRRARALHALGKTRDPRAFDALVAGARARRRGTRRSPPARRAGWARSPTRGRCRCLRDALRSAPSRIVAARRGRRARASSGRSVDAVRTRRGRRGRRTRSTTAVSRARVGVRARPKGSPTRACSARSTACADRERRPPAARRGRGGDPRSRASRRRPEAVVALREEVDRLRADTQALRERVDELTARARRRGSRSLMRSTPPPQRSR